MNNIRFGKDLKYTWEGYPYCWFYSMERGVYVGHVRFVEGALFYVNNVYAPSKFFQSRVDWKPVRPSKDKDAFKKRITT